MKPLLSLLLLIVPLTSLAQSTTSGDCSPAVAGGIGGNVTNIINCKFDRTSIPPGLTPYTDDNEVFSFFFPTEFQELERIRQREDSGYYEYEVGLHWLPLTKRQLEQTRSKTSFLIPVLPKFNGLVIGFFEFSDKSISDREWDDRKWTFVKTSLRGKRRKGDIPKEDIPEGLGLQVMGQYKNASARRSVVAIKRMDFGLYVVTRFDEADGMGMFAEATVRKSDWENYQNLVFNSLLSIKWSPSKARAMARKMANKP